MGAIYTGKSWINRGTVIQHITMWGEIEQLLNQKDNCIKTKSTDFDHENGYITNRDSWVLDEIPGFRQLPVDKMGKIN